MFDESVISRIDNVGQEHASSHMRRNKMKRHFCPSLTTIFPAVLLQALLCYSFPIVPPQLSASGIRSVKLHMALTPVGPFCPFRSEAAEEISPKIEQLQVGDAAEFAE
jgi:hypothetical protein